MSDENMTAKLVALIRERFALQASGGETPAQRAAAARLIPSGADYRFSKATPERRAQIDAEIDALLTPLPKEDAAHALDIAIREADLGGQWGRPGQRLH